MKVLGVPVSIWRRLYMINLVIIALVAAIGFSLPAAHAQNVTISSARNCDANAVIFCGAGSVSELINKFNNGDGRNSAASIHNIFSFFGVSAADVQSMNNSGVNVQAGSVDRSGQVFNGSGQLVATSAMTGGRQNIAGSTREMVGGTVFFVRPPSVSFVSSPLKAFVVMQNGQFQFAVLSSCGNVVKATPMAPAPKPAPKPTPAPAKPTPKPTQTTNVCTGNTTNTNTGIASQGGNCSTNTTVVQTQTTPAAPTPAPTTPAPATPTPAPPPTCDALTISQGDNRTVTITNLQTTPNGATMTGVDINWGDGTMVTNAPSAIGLTHQFAADGTFTISAVVHFTLNGATTSTPANNAITTSVNAGANAAAGNGASASTNANTQASMSSSAAAPQTTTASGPNCQQQVTFMTPAPTPVTPAAQVTAPVTTTPAPTSLVNTGPGSIAGLAAIAAGISLVGYRLMLRHYMNRL